MMLLRVAKGIALYEGAASAPRAAMVVRRNGHLVLILSYSTWSCYLDPLPEQHPGAEAACA